MFSTLTLSSPAIINNLIHLYLIITLLAILFFAYVMSAEASSKAVLLGGLTVNTANIFKIFQCFMLLLLLLFKSTYFVSAGFFFSHLYACHIFYHMQIAVLFLFFFVQYLLFNIFSCTSKDRLITSIVLVVLLILLQYI